MPDLPDKLSPSSSLFFARVLAVFALLATYLLLNPYPKVLFLATCLAILLVPVFEILVARFSLYRAIVISSISILLMVLLPVTLFAVLIIPQALNGIRIIQRWRAMGWEIPIGLKEKIEEVYAWIITEVPPMEKIILDTFTELDSNLNTVMNKIVPMLLSGSVGIAGGVLNTLWYIMLFVILTVLFLTYAQPIKDAIDKLLYIEAKKGMIERFIEAFRAALRSVVMGIFFVAFLQCLVCTSGFVMFGVSEPFFWGFLCMFLAPIPFVGTCFIWFPMTLLLWGGGEPFMAVGLASWVLIFGTTIDNFVSPYFLSTGIRAPFFVLVLSLFCGLAVFGAVGLIVGPVVVTFALQCAMECIHLLGVEVPIIREQTEKIKKSKFQLDKLTDKMKKSKFQFTFFKKIIKEIKDYLNK